MSLKLQEHLFPLILRNEYEYTNSTSSWLPHLSIHKCCNLIKLNFLCIQWLVLSFERAADCKGRKLSEAAICLRVCFPHRVPGLRKEQVLPLVQPQYGSLEARQLLHTHTPLKTKSFKKCWPDSHSSKFWQFSKEKLGESHLWNFGISSTTMTLEWKLASLLSCWQTRYPQYSDTAAHYNP